MKKIIDIIEEGCLLLNSVSPIKKKISPTVKRKRHLDYLKKKSSIKLKNKKYRKTTQFKKWKLVSKVKSKSGRTATGKRKVNYY